MTSQRPSVITLLVAVLLAVHIAQPAAEPDPRRRAGCLWDRDTLAQEAARRPGAAPVLTGRFDRFPPAYYEHRLTRVLAALGADPDRLNLYDDAGVACDRMKRSDEAIGWMRKKQEAMARLGAASGAPGQGLADHRYRYLANLATFHIHRWVRDGRDQNDKSDLALARDLIVEAIELNPSAHFGRERYQLLAVEWVLRDPAADAVDRPTFLHMIPGFAERTSGSPPFDKRLLKRLGYGDAVEGLMGLVVLGEGWESLDVFYALSWALNDEGEGALAKLALLRVGELIDDGKRSLSPRFQHGGNWYSLGQDWLPSRHAMAIERYYPRAREEADEWLAQRHAYINTQIRQGLHPDTHPGGEKGFWSRWVEPGFAPPLPSGAFWTSRKIAYALVAALAVITLLVMARGRTRTARRASPPAPIA